MSLTKGLGEHWGNYLVAVPFRLRFIRWIKKIVKRIVRWIPWKKKKFTYKIRITGDLYYPRRTLLEIPIKGERDHFWVLWVLALEDED